MKPIDWLLGNERYVELATRLHILKQNYIELETLKKEVLLDPRIKKYLTDVSDFNGTVVTNHKNPELPIYKLIFLLDIGFDTSVPEIDTAIKQILLNIGEDGIFKCMTNIPKHFGGTGINSLTWCLCDAPLMFYALLRAGVSYSVHLKQGVEYIAGLARYNGFPCAASKELGKFRGPGKKEDCCPFATLIILKLFALIPEYANSEIAITGIKALLDLWENSKEQHPYIFYMGTDFRKLKAPTIWYDIVSVTDCLSHYEYAKNDKRFQEMVDIIQNKANSEYQFIPESVYQKCNDWDFGQKKLPSAWLTYLCISILERCGRTRFD
jgi:hypothetical protein